MEVGETGGQKLRSHNPAPFPFAEPELSCWDKRSQFCKTNQTLNSFFFKILCHFKPPDARVGSETNFICNMSSAAIITSSAFATQDHMLHFEVIIIILINRTSCDVQNAVEIFHFGAI